MASRENSRRSSPTNHRDRDRERDRDRDRERESYRDRDRDFDRGRRGRDDRDGRNQRSRSRSAERYSQRNRSPTRKSDQRNRSHERDRSTLDRKDQPGITEKKPPVLKSFPTQAMKIQSEKMAIVKRLTNGFTTLHLSSTSLCLIFLQTMIPMKKRVRSIRISTQRQFILTPLKLVMTKTS
jgi:hypothetical protein